MLCYRLLCSLNKVNILTFPNENKGPLLNQNLYFLRFVNCTFFPHRALKSYQQAFELNAENRWMLKSFQPAY